MIWECILRHLTCAVCIESANLTSRIATYNKRRIELLLRLASQFQLDFENRSVDLCRIFSENKLFISPSNFFYATPKYGYRNKPPLTLKPGKKRKGVISFRASSFVNKRHQYQGVQAFRGSVRNVYMAVKEQRQHCTRKWQSVPSSLPNTPFLEMSELTLLFQHCLFLDLVSRHLEMRGCNFYCITYLSNRKRWMYTPYRYIKYFCVIE